MKDNPSVLIVWCVFGYCTVMPQKSGQTKRVSAVEQIIILGEMFILEISSEQYCPRHLLNVQPDQSNVMEEKTNTSRTDGHAS